MKTLPKLENQSVKVYKNLKFKTPCYSIAHKGKVIGHAKTVVLYHARFHVNENGRQKVLREQRKNVHAWAMGYLVYASNEDVILKGFKLKYNPYKTDHFYEEKSGNKVHSADQLSLTDSGIYGEQLTLS